jgi:K+-transporting ATPase ATPase B chain
MSRKQLALLEPTLVRQALLDAVKKLSPRVQWRNPVMFIVWVGSVLTTLLAIAMASGHLPAAPGLPAPSVSGCGLPCCSPTLPKRWRKAAVKQANSLKGVKNRLRPQIARPQHDAQIDHVPADELRKGDVVLVEAGILFPAMAKSSKAASVDESAITGESAPVIRESGGDFASVTGGTHSLRLAGDPCSVNPGETFLTG